MKVFIINGSPGVGKTTLLNLLEKKLPSNCALLDEDDIARTIPLNISKKRFELIHNNLITCAKNFKYYGIECLIISAVIPQRERFKKLVKRFKANDNEVYHIVCDCDLNELKKRIKNRKDQDVIDLKCALRCNEKINNLDSHFTVNTGESPENVRDSVLDFVNKVLD